MNSEAFGIWILCWIQRKPGFHNKRVQENAAIVKLCLLKLKL